jgi:multicomponent Na+:H+ antiporter subunit D
VSYSELLPLLLVVSPILSGLIILFIPESNRTLRTLVNILGSGIVITLIVLLLKDIYNGQEFESRYSLLPTIDLVLHVDALSLIFVTLSGLLWLLTTIYAIGYLEGAKNRSRFFGFFGLCVGSTIGVALAGNLITFLIFYELLTLATFPLLAHRGNVASIKATRVYLIYTMVGGAVLMAAVVWLKALAGPLDFTATGILGDIPGLDRTYLQIIFAMLIIGLGVKAAIFPLHGWLPVSMAAPAPVSALLHAVAVVKAGAFGIIRVIYDIYGIDFASSLGLTQVLAVFAGFTIIYGSVKALSQDDIKKRLAYSTVSQVSYIALGAAIAGPIATVGGLVHLVHQGLMKITMFFCAGNLAETLGIHKVSELAGAGKRMPLTMTAFTIAALGMIGLPPIAGFISKWYLGMGALEANIYWVLGVLAISSLLNAMYFLPIIHAVWFKESGEDWPHEKIKGTHAETRLALLLPPLVTAALALLVGLMASSSASPLGWAILITAREYANISSQLRIPDTLFSVNYWWLLLAPCVLLFGFLIKPLKELMSRLIPLAVLPVILVALISTFAQDMVSLSLVDRTFLLLVGVLWFCVSIYAQNYLKSDPKKIRFFVFFLMTMIGNIGVVLSDSVSAFLSFFTIMSLAAYPLILHSGGAANTAAKIYIQWVVIGEVILFAGLVGRSYFGEFSGIDFLNSTHVVWVSTLLIIGFGVKAGLVPTHVWLPKAHPVAPVPASALLSAVMVKVGVLGWIRFLPLGEISLISLAQAMMVLGFSGAVLAALYGVLQSNIKTVLAYSTISQLGIISATIGLGLGYPAAWPSLLPVVLLFVLHHGFSKATLFLSVSLAPELARNSLSKYLVWFVMIVPAISLIGLPLTSGAVAKSELKSVAEAWPVFVSLLSISAIGTTLLMARYFELMRLQASKSEVSKRVRWGLLLPTLSVSVISLSFFYVMPDVPSFGAEILSSKIILGSIWPVVLGIILFVLISKLRRYRSTELPAGDILVVFEFISALLKIIIVKINRVNKILLSGIKEYFNIFYRNMNNLIADKVVPINGVIGQPSLIFSLVIILVFFSFIKFI